MQNEQSVRWDTSIGSVMRMWFAPPPFENWAFVLPLDDGVYVIDTGTDGYADAMIDRLNERDIQVDHILLTHHHATHAANAPKVAQAFGATIWAHKESAPLCAQGGVTIDRVFHGGDVIGGALDVIDAPGHAPGNVAFYWRKERVMLPGDTVMGLGDSTAHPLCLPGPDKGASAAQVKEDARKLLSLDIAVCLPAHGRHVVEGNPIPYIEGLLR